VLIGTAITVGVGMLTSLSHGMPRARSADERGLGR
jgi:hypothetical protein